MKSVFYDKSVGGFYISKRTIPDSVKQRGTIQQMISAQYVLELVHSAFRDGAIAGYHCCAEGDWPYYLEDVKKKLESLK